MDKIKQEVEDIVKSLYKGIEGRDISKWIKAITRYEIKIVTIVLKLIQCLSTINEEDSVLLYASLVSYMNNKNEESMMQVFILHLILKYPENEYPDVHVYINDLRVIIKNMMSDKEID